MRINLFVSTDCANEKKWDNLENCPTLWSRLIFKGHQAELQTFLKSV
jgi:hypothetical protein